MKASVCWDLFLSLSAFIRTIMERDDGKKKQTLENRATQPDLCG